MKPCNVVLQFGAGIKSPEPEITEFKVLKTTTYYNYFCLKLNCFEAYFGTIKGMLKNCPICKKNDKVVAKFE
jgi:hypothetical protein